MGTTTLTSLHYSPPFIICSLINAANSIVTDMQYAKFVNSTINPKSKGRTDAITIRHIMIEYVGVPKGLR